MAVPVPDLALGETTRVRCHGVWVVVCRTAEGVFAIDDTCPHAGGSLGSGELEGCWLSCPIHGWDFDVRTGRCAVVEGFDVQRWSVREEEGQLWVE